MSQQSKTTLQSAINTQIADNTSGDISAADIRDNLINITDSLLFNTGSGQAITGSLTITEGITGSLLGTASYATQALSASWAPSVASNPFPFTGSAIISGSLTVTGSINNTGGITGSLLGTASWASSASQAISASYALSASWAPNPFPFIGTARITGSLLITGSGLALASTNGNGTISPNFNYANIYSEGAMHIKDDGVYHNRYYVTNPAGTSGTHLGVDDIYMYNSTDSIDMWLAGFGGINENTLSFNGAANAAIYSDNKLRLKSTSTEITGSTRITGSLVVTGSTTSTSGFTGSLLGTASYATQALSASWAPSVASNPFPFTGSAIISGSLVVTGSVAIGNGDITVSSPSVTTKIAITDGFMTNEMKKTSIQMVNPQGPNTYSLGSFVYDPAGSPFFPTSNAIYSTGTTDLLISSQQKLNIEATSTEITGSLKVTGSTSLNGLMTLQPANPLPSVTNGSIAYSSSGDFYFGSGSAWRKLTL